MSNDNKFIKDPQSVLDYTLDWSDWLGSDTISQSTFTVPSGITKDSDSFDDTTATIWLSSGTLGKKYTITNKIVTNGGRTDERSLIIVIKNK